MCQKDKIFIGWSRDTSKKVAEILRGWIPTVLQHVETFVSSQDIGKGSAWLESLTKELNNSSMGIIVLTPGNIGSPWINFEAGAIFRNTNQYSSKGNAKVEKVYTFLFNVDPSKLAGPLTQFQSTRSDPPGYDKDDICKLLKEINKHTHCSLQEQILEKVFESHWESLRRELQRIGGDRWAVPSEQEYLQFRFERKNNTIKVSPMNNEPVIISGKMDLDKWKDKVDKMRRFINGKDDEIEEVGLAIGVQNFIYLTGADQWLVGLRTKAADPNICIGAVLAKGFFNTGYALIRRVSTDNINPWESPAILQDLFHIKKIAEKHYITGDPQQVCDALKIKSSKNICDIEFANGEKKRALIFVNASRYFPRFEVGIIKYMNLSKSIDKNYIDAFGKDSLEDENYWIWIADGKIIMRSYSSGRYIPNIGVTSSLYDKKWLLVKNDYLEQEFGLTERYLPLASDEELNLEVALNRPLSSPARSIAELF